MSEFLLWGGGITATIGVGLYDIRAGLIAGGALAISIGILLTIGTGNVDDSD